MKKVIYSVTMIVALSLSSCGKSACDCKKSIEENSIKMFKEKNNTKLEDLNKESKDLEKDCQKHKDADYEKCK